VLACLVLDSMLRCRIVINLLLSRMLKPKFHFTDFHRNFPAGKVVDANGDKSWNHEVSVKVADTNHLDMSRCLRQSPWQIRDKPVCVALMEFSPLQCMGKVGDKVGDKVCGLCRGHKSRKSATQIMKVGDVICVRDTSTTLSGTCPGLCRKVGVMEFGL